MKFLSRLSFFAFSALAALPFSAPAHAQSATPSAKPAPFVAILSSTHPAGVFHDFNTPIISSSPTPQYVAFTPYAVAGGVPSGAKFAVRDGALQMTNAWAGSFGVDLKIAPFDAGQLGHLFFDYKLNPGVRVNIFFRVKGKYHGVIFSGPKQVRPGGVLLGVVEDVRADGQWHRAHIPLRDWLQKLYPLETNFAVDEAIIGNWDNSGYLMAGFGGNAPGVSWSMDNFALVGAQAAGAEAKFDFRGYGDTPLKTPSKYFYSVDGGAPQPVKSASLTLKAADGLHVLRVGEKKAGQSTLDTSHGAARAFWISSTAPTVGAPQWDNNDITIPIQSSAGLTRPPLKFTVGNKAYGADSSLLVWDGQQLRFDAAAAGLRPANGSALDLQIAGVTDTFGRKAADRKFDLKTDFAKHTAVPIAPTVRLMADEEANALANSGSFEDGLEGWNSVGGSGGNDALIDRDDSTAALGKYSVRLTCPANAAPFRANIRNTPVDVGRFPILSFDYKIPAGLRVDFQLWFDNRPWKIVFTDRDGSYPSLGTVPNVIADEAWHHADIDLGALLRAAKPDATSLIIGWLAIGDSGWLGNARNLQYWFDNFHFVPVVGGAPLKATAQLQDISGVKAVSYTVDDKPNSVPPTTNGKAGNQIEANGKGRRWLHLRAQNGAGQWSATEHLPLLLDAAAPQTGKVTPAVDAHAAPSAMTWAISDDVGADPSSIALHVNDRDFDLKNAALHFDARSGKLTWDVLAAVDGGLAPPGNGGRVAWRLAPVRDFGGNTAPEQSGAWIYDWAADKSGPVVRVSSSTHPSMATFDFENSIAWDALDGGAVSIVDGEGNTPATPNHALRVTNTAAPRTERQLVMGGRLNAAAADAAPVSLGIDSAYSMATVAVGAFDATKWNIISFRYRIPRAANVALRARLSDGRAWHIRLNGEANDSLGSVPGIKADNQWHWAQFDILPLLRRDPRLDPSQVRALDILDPMKKTAVGVAFEIDDFTLAQAAPAPFKAAWHGVDLSGATKYRLAWDQSPSTAPGEETTDMARDFSGVSGTWFLHLQSQDGAGNWGPITHFPVLIR